MDKVVSFVPPDGNFELMRYRVRNTAARMFHPPISCHSQWTYGDASTVAGGSSTLNGRVSITLSVRSVTSLVFSASRRGPMVVEDVAVTIPFPRAVRTANLSVSAGHVIYDEATKVAKWTIGKLDGHKKPQLQGTMVLEGSRKPEEEQNLTLNWKIPLASVSGLSVSGLSLTGESYNVYKGVRNITKSGRFQVRCN